MVEPILDDGNKPQQLTEETAWDEMLQKAKEIEVLINIEEGRRRNKEREENERRRIEEVKKRIAKLREKDEQ